MAEAIQPFSEKELTVSHVIVLAAQGNVPVQVRAQDLQAAFGKFGPAHFATIPPNGYIVQLGPANHLLFQPPRIEFKAASEDMLLELFRNASGHVLSPFMGRSATAFGINFEIEVAFNDLPASAVFQKLRPTYLPPGATLSGAKFKVVHPPQSNEYNFVFDYSPTTKGSIIVNANHHISNPNTPCLNLSELVGRIADARSEYKKFLGEINQCVQSHN